MRKRKNILLFCLGTLLIANLSCYNHKKIEFIPNEALFEFELIQNKSPDELRIVKILIVTDQMYQKQIPGWQDEITNLVNIVSDTVYKQAGIKLEIVALQPWQRDSLEDSDCLDLFNELEKKFRGKMNMDFEILLGLTSHHLYNSEYKISAAGWSQPQECTILIRNKKGVFSFYSYSFKYSLMSAKERKEKHSFLILHEIGHIFGCNECPNDHCAMFPYDYSNYSFCEKCVQTIKKWKWRKIPNLEENK